MFITVDFKMKKEWVDAKWMVGHTLNETFSGFMDLSVQKPGSSPGSTYANFSEHVRKRMQDPPFNHVMPAEDKVWFILQVVKVIISRIVDS